MVQQSEITPVTWYKCTHQLVPGYANLLVVAWYSSVLQRVCDVVTSVLVQLRSTTACRLSNRSAIIVQRRATAHLLGDSAVRVWA
eukprot:1861075-Rhodomonas_salina.3